METNLEGKIVAIKHVEKEGPGLIETFFGDDGWQLETVELSKGEKLPESMEDIAAVIVLGGPMNVYEESAYPFLKDEDRFIRKVLVEEIPFLGICLGSQLLSKACGGKIDKSPVKEVGWYNIEVTRDGHKDLLFRGLPRGFKVFQWHEDTFEVPEGGVLLAKGKGCKNQAFKIGSNAYGLQFHVEATEEMIDVWLKDEDGNVDARRILADTKRIKESLEGLTGTMLLNFKRIIESSLRIKKIMKLFVEDEKTSSQKKTLLWWNVEEHAFVPAKA